MLVGIFSPLVKMFAATHEVWDKDGKVVIRTLEEVQDNPDLLFSEEKFAVNVPRSSGDQRFVYGQPRFIRDQDLIGWLTGGDEGSFVRETDWSGCVQLQLPPDAMGEMMAAIASGEKGSSVDSELARATAKAREISKTRCMRQVKFVWDNYLSQVALNKEQNLGEPRFSPTEYLASKVLAKDLQAIQAKDAARRKEMEQLTSTLAEGVKAHGPRS